ncbi:MAG: hypothetical protein M0P01_11435 [Treponema sp.]|nr:hypothetical protein [Treponema sp.]
MAVFVVTIGILTIVLWIVLLVKFKKLFSTDDVIAKTRSEMNNMILDINRNAERNINLMDDRIQKLKLIIAEADRHIALARVEEEKLASVQELRTAVNRTPAAEKRAADIYKHTAGITKPRPESAYEVTDTGIRAAGVQKTLFDESTKDSGTQTKMVVREDGTAYAEVPVIAPKVYFSETPVEPKKNFNKLVTDFASTGLSVEQIAKKLSCSLSEVQMVLDMNS